MTVVSNSDLRRISNALPGAPAASLAAVAFVLLLLQFVAAIPFFVLLQLSRFSPDWHPAFLVALAVWVSTGMASAVVSLVGTARKSQERWGGYSTSPSDDEDLFEVAPGIDIVIRLDHQPALNDVERAERLHAAYSIAGRRAPWPIRVVGTIRPAWTAIFIFVMIFGLGNLVFFIATGGTVD